MRTGIRILLFFLLILTFGFILYFSYKEVRLQTVNKLNEKQMIFAKQAAKAIEFFFKEHISLATYLASDPAVINLSDEGILILKKVQANHSEYIKAITRYDSEGTITYSYPNPEKVAGKNISSQSHVKKLLKERKPIVSDVFISIQGFQTVAMAVPVFSDGKFDGALSFLIDFKYISATYLDVIQIGNDGYAWMISREGVELFCPVPGHIGVNIEKTSKAFPSVLILSEEMKKGKSGYGTYTYDMTKDRKVTTIVKHAAYAPVNIAGNLWSIAVATPESEIYTELSDFYKRMMIALFGIFISAGIVGYVMLKDYQLKKINTELEKRIGEEIEKRKQQERMMLQQARFYSMGETLNAIAHQWRQPLNAIGLCVQDIEDAYESGTLDEKYITEITDMTMKNLEGLSQIIDNFRTFFSSDENPEKTDICRLIREIYSIIRAQLDSENIGFTLVVGGSKADLNKPCGSDAYSAVIYPGMLKQVILICIQNAKEAITRSGVKGEIILTLTKENGEFTIVVTDNGGGISAEILENIFDPYFSTKDIHIGMGMGLYTAKGIMEEHLGGTIKISNHNDGAKAVLKFRS